MLFAAVHESAIGTLSPSAVVPTAGQKLKAKRTVLAGHPAVIVSCGPLCFINSLQWPWQVLNPAVECLIVRFRHNHVHIARVVIERVLCVVEAVAGASHQGRRGADRTHWRDPCGFEGHLWGAPHTCRVAGHWAELSARNGSPV
jgi:hypothetical protein